jgi:hypothetical protein
MDVETAAVTSAAAAAVGVVSSAVSAVQCSAVQCSESAGPSHRSSRPIVEPIFAASPGHGLVLRTAY